MSLYPCPYLQGEVEISEEREKHIAENHPELLPDHKEQLKETLAAPDQVRRSRRMGNARLFSKWYDDVVHSKHVVVVVVSESAPRNRNWIVTAYVTGRIPEGEPEWERN